MKLILTSFVFISVVCSAFSFVPLESTKLLGTGESLSKVKEQSRNYRWSPAQDDASYPVYRSSTSLNAFSFPNLMDVFTTSDVDNNQSSASSTTTSGKATSMVKEFFNSYNNRDYDELVALFTDEFVYEDTNFAKSVSNKDELERFLRLNLDAYSQKRLFVEDIVVDKRRTDDDSINVGVFFKTIEEDSFRGCATFVTNSDGFIETLFIVNESSNKKGEDDLQLLSKASKVMDIIGYNPAASNESEEKYNGSTTSKTVAEKYFDAWNRRDMDSAVALFTDDVKYDDTAFPQPFTGKNKLLNHLKICESSLPVQFNFVIDNVIDGKNRIITRWHVENGNEPLPFTRGCSYYKVTKGGLIEEGTDIVEPSGPIKPGGIELFKQSMQNKLTQEPIRFIPLASWIAYMYIVFFSDGILPGANALQLEQRTWEEVFNLSLNFFLVSPILHLPFAPVVHPMLEGVFNLLLSWAALFAGFLSDDRKNKPNLLPMFPMVVGMQFLTSAFLLPYITTRTSEKEQTSIAITEDELDLPAKICESPWLGISMAFVGTGSIFWGLFARVDNYGAEFSERYASFIDLLSIDRVGSSFIVDLAIFALFQGWMVDDDLRRRGINPSLPENNGKTLSFIGKYIPFFGLAAYYVLRPTIQPTTSIQPSTNTPENK